MAAAIPDSVERQAITLTGAAGNALCADLFMPLHATGGMVILAHGGGQTRHSWGNTARTLAARGWRALLYDQRGHGDSAWVADGAYAAHHYAEDLVAVARQMDRANARPVIVGASLGGLAGLIAAGELDHSAFRALVLVDVTPGMKPEGVGRILAFMSTHAEDGFATIEEAADAIAAYLPHRPRPRSLTGLGKNLRLGPDGRYRWHWDPRFLEARKAPGGHARELESRLASAARGLAIPVLLLRGRESELVGEAEAEAFRRLVPHAEIAEVPGARHMVAGDRNDVFGAAVAEFLARL